MDSTVTVIIACYNQLKTLPLVLSSFIGQTILPKSVIVADDGSSDGVCDWLDGLNDDAYPFEVWYTTDSHIGYGLTVVENRAAKMVSDGRILFTNADVVHNPTSVETHSVVPDNIVAGGYIREIGQPYSDKITVDSIKDFSSFIENFGTHCTDLTNRDYLAGEPRINFYGVWGGNFSIHSFRFSAVGGFNEEYRGLYGGEEADLLRRFMMAGGDIAWAYNSVAYHLAHNSKNYRVEAAGNKKYKRDHQGEINSNESRCWHTSTNGKWI